jgi:hypothetical protein
MRSLVLGDRSDGVRSCNIVSELVPAADCCSLLVATTFRGSYFQVNFVMHTTAWVISMKRLYDVGRE